MPFTFWKLSQGAVLFETLQVISFIEQKLVYVHLTSPAKGKSSVTQAENFIDADIGDYFYLTHGNKGVTKWRNARARSSYSNFAYFP